MNMIRSKAFRRLIEIARVSSKSLKEIVKMFNINTAPAYDFWVIIKELKAIFAKEINEKFEKLERELEKLNAEIKSKNLENRLIKLEISLTFREEKF